MQLCTMLQEADLNPLYVPRLCNACIPLCNDSRATRCVKHSEVASQLQSQLPAQTRTLGQTERAAQHFKPRFLRALSETTFRSQAGALLRVLLLQILKYHSASYTTAVLLCI